MSTSLFLAAALVAQPFLTSAAVMIAPLAAIARIENSDLARAGDPLALINLGTAYKMVGRKDEAARLYRTAAHSDDRYDVQLADGRWIDSRRAATLAIAGLGRDDVLALR
ncbi:MAG: hypothetical protein NTX28_13440 [Novosphingobium sp.]|nr:hypothetical protein [Novosphingobium sp.]